jgi:hypothetical protein
MLCAVAVAGVYRQAATRVVRRRNFMGIRDLYHVPP